MIEGLSEWLAEFESGSFQAKAAAETGVPAETCRMLIASFANEARAYAPVLAKELQTGDRVLEVGSGLGFLSLWLSRKGFKVTAIEPGVGPYGPFRPLAAFIAGYGGSHRPAMHSIGAEALDAKLHGRFDLIFSFNVLEHISELGTAFAAMAEVLSPGGRMLHVCPNYRFPYEPHLNMPLLPFAPAATARIFPGQVWAERKVWDTLNFITASQLRQLARAHGLKLTLLPGQLHSSLDRLAADPAFRARRNSGPFGRTMAVGLKLAGALGLLTLARRLPPDWVTPMTAVIHKPEDA